MNKVAKCVSLVASLSTVSACATDPNKIASAYVSPLKYEGYDCQQIAVEQAGIEERTNVLYHNLKSRNNSDKWMMGVGLLVAWPALLFMKGNNSAENAEFAQLKGNYDALQHTAIEKKCGLAFAGDLRNVVKRDAAGVGTPKVLPVPANAPLVPQPAPLSTNDQASLGPRKIRAGTPSGYCLDVPAGYVGTGAANMPSLSSAMPACDQLGAKDDSSPLRSYRH